MKSFNLANIEANLQINSKQGVLAAKQASHSLFLLPPSVTVSSYLSLQWKYIFLVDIVDKVDIVGLVDKLT
jgi:hypothetical protein